MEDYEEVPSWLGTCIWYYPEWNSRNNKSTSNEKWGICWSKDNHSDAAYNYEVADIRADFELGLSHIGLSDYEADLKLLRDTLIMIDKKLKVRPMNILEVD